MGAPQNFRQRYIAFRVDNNVNRRELEREIERWGEKTSHFYDPWLVIYEGSQGEGLIKCEQEQVEELKLQMSESENFDITVLGLSGTIKKARQKFLTSSSNS